VHGLADVNFEGRIPPIAPSVFYAHNHYGQCISGTKCFQRPQRTPCTRKFGAACLAQFLPRGCGGRNPIQMFKDYQLQQHRLNLLRTYKRVLTNSHYLSSEFSRNGIQASCVPYFVSNPPTAAPAIGEFALPAEHNPWQVLFLGRAERLKGGDLLLKALPELARKLNHPISLTFAGDGPALPAWKRIGDRVRSDRVQVDFIGWTTRIEDLLSKAHLLVMPSIWPEPFGLSGVEAGNYAVPAVAFASGGIPDWLHDGENGHLAPSDPPTANGLASAMICALSNRDHYLRLRANALIRARDFSLSRHMDSLLDVFEQAVGRTHAPQPETVVAG
jgi:glycosyltransferase involved in cell wall biosynthesis